MRRRLKILSLDLPKDRLLPATGILLAGGKSSRMKRNKAFLELEGKPLVERSLEVLQSVFQEVLISSNQPELYSAYKVKVVPDKIANQGPIGGLHAGLIEAQHENNFFVACDMPFLDSELIRLLAKWAAEYEVVVPRMHNGFLHPLHAFYKRSCLPHIEKNLKDERLKIIDFYSKCSVRYVEEKEIGDFKHLEKTLSNVNTPEDWSSVTGTY